MNSSFVRVTVSVAGVACHADLPLNDAALRGLSESSSEPATPEMVLGILTAAAGKHLGRAERRQHYRNESSARIAERLLKQD